MNLTEFLLARIAEDEREARDELPNVADSDFLFKWQPSRVLAECEAKRLIVTAYTDLATTCDHMPWVNLGGSCQCGAVAHSLLALASVYADHPDFRQEWKPARL